jgi:hypothetical protein
MKILESEKTYEGRKDEHLALKILHNVQEMVVNVWFIEELHLDRVEVAQRVCHVQRAIVPIVAVGSEGSSIGDSSRVHISAALCLHGLLLVRRRAGAGTSRHASERLVRAQSRWRRLR